MKILQEICLQSLEILILVLGLTGVVISILLLISPRMIKTFSSVFDKRIFVDRKLSYLNREVVTDSITYRYNVPTGLVLIAGSVFLLIFLFFQLDIQKITNFFSDVRYPFIYEMIAGVLILVGKIAAFAGLVAGLLLSFVPEIMIKIEDKMDSWFSTQYMVDKLDKFHHGLD
ncbi:hypothetical protein ACFLZL_05505, partial [Thermodesulfobacteriota bacterium]